MERTVEDRPKEVESAVPELPEASSRCGISRGLKLLLEQVASGQPLDEDDVYEKLDLDTGVMLNALGRAVVALALRLKDLSGRVDALESGERLNKDILERLKNKDVLKRLKALRKRA